MNKVSELLSNEAAQRMLEVARSIEQSVGSALLGKGPQVRMATAAILARQHILLTDVPGSGKTTMAMAMARAVGGTFGRIQGNPDLLPSDMTGFHLYDQHTHRWTYRPGPLLHNVVLVDELNRITPRSQSALLQAMAEGEITIDGETIGLPEPFLVVATMNPFGDIGTFPMGEAQLDRFGLALSLGIADPATERQVLKGKGGAAAVNAIVPAVPIEVLPDISAVIGEIHVAEPVLDYLLAIAEGLRASMHISTRALHATLALARALAALDGRPFVTPDDIRALAVPCLAHRTNGDLHGCDVVPTIRSVVEAVPIAPLAA